MLYAFGDDPAPLASTALTLDSLVTDYIIELCHEAESRARVAGRTKVKVDDFQFALREDGAKVGRVQELMDLDRYIKRERQAFDAKKQMRAAVRDAAGAGTAEDEEGAEGKEEGAKDAGEAEVEGKSVKAEEMSESE